MLYFKVERFYHLSTGQGPHGCKSAPIEVLDAIGGVAIGESCNCWAKEVRDLWTLAPVIVGTQLTSACWRDGSSPHLVYESSSWIYVSLILPASFTFW